MLFVWITKFGHEFVNQKQYFDSQVVNKKLNSGTIAIYYMNKFICLDDIFNYLDNIVFKSESKTFKLEFKLSGIFETQIKKNKAMRG